MSLPTRTLGRNGPQVTCLNLGLMGLSAFYGPTKPDNERFAFLDRAFELGITFWDTADLYGDSEELLGEWFRKTGNRNRIFLASKFGARNPEKPKDGPQGDREYVKIACERSLKRLGVDCIDLYYIHRVDKRVPIEETIEAMLDLKKEGKIKHIGISECSADTLRRASKLTQIAAYQIEYSPFFTDIEHAEIGALDACRELGISVVTYSPLGRGMLTGKYRSVDDFAPDDFRRMIPRYSNENFPKCLELVDKLKEMAEKKGVTASQLVLAWILEQGDDFIPLFGTADAKNLESNIKAVEVKLSKEEVHEIRRWVNSVDITAARYPEGMLDLVTDTPLPKM